MTQIQGTVLLDVSESQNGGRSWSCDYLFTNQNENKKSPTKNGKNIERRYNNEWGKLLHVNFWKYVENRKLQNRTVIDVLHIKIV